MRASVAALAGAKLEQSWSKAGAKLERTDMRRERSARIGR